MLKKQRATLNVAIRDGFIWLLFEQPVANVQLTPHAARGIARALEQHATKLEGGGTIIIPRGPIVP